MGIGTLTFWNRPLKTLGDPAVTVNEQFDAIDVVTPLPVHPL